MPRLIDADALKKDWRMGSVCETCSQDTRQCCNDYCFSRMDVCEMIDDAPTVNSWISVKDRLPDRDDNYLVTVKLSYGGDPWYVCIATYRHVHPDRFGCFGILNEKDGQMYRGAVTHWAPLPKPPEESA